MYLLRPIASYRALEILTYIDLYVHRSSYPPRPTFLFLMEPARSGRQNAQYDGDTRLVAGCLPVMPDGRVVLIRSVKRTDWILPKGGWESDETAAEAAVREAYEEAGVRRKMAFVYRKCVGRETKREGMVGGGGLYSRLV